MELSDMQGSFEENLNPDRVSDTETKLSQDFAQILNFSNGSMFDFVDKEENEAVSDNSDSDDDDEEEGEFSFMCGESNSSPISAEDAFINGQIKPIFPLFNQGFTISAEDLPFKLPVNKVFVETEEGYIEATSSALGNDEVVGPYCEWSNPKVVEVEAREGCKKSNSTGFCKIWRFKELMGRSNSDGRDAFVFLNNAHAPAQEEKREEVKVEKETAVKVKVKKTSKSKTAPLSAHEVYLKSKAKDNRRRSYLPYRTGLMGFFTNVNGGLTKNVHPY